MNSHHPLVHFCEHISGFAAGVAIGIAVGVATHNVAVGIALAVSLGAAFQKNRRSRDQNDQTDECADHR